MEWRNDFWFALSCRVLKVQRELKVQVWVKWMSEVHFYGKKKRLMDNLHLCFFQGPAGPKGDTGIIGPPGPPVSILLPLVFSIKCKTLTVQMCHIQVHSCLKPGPTRWGHRAPPHSVTEEDQTLGWHAVGHGRHHHGLWRRHGGHLWLTQQPQTGHWAHEIPHGYAE